MPAGGGDATVTIGSFASDGCHVPPHMVSYASPWYICLREAWKAVSAYR